MNPPHEWRRRREAQMSRNANERTGAATDRNKTTAMTLLRLLLLLLVHILLPFHVFTLTTCPRQCICHEHSIACSCETAEKSELIISSLGSTYITSLVVHSCDKVTVANGSFAGVVLVERLSFIAIGHLYFEPFSFKDILQSPRQLVIDECTIPSLAPVAFAGLSHIDHLWFRNSRIDVIATEAFHYLTNIDYIYFHKTKIGRVERRAFSKMYQIDHLYFKDSIEIDFIETEAFSGSQVDELIFDGARIREAHDTFLLNIDSADTVLKNCTVHLVARREENVLEIEKDQELIDRCLIESSSFNVLSPYKLGCVVLEVTSSTLDKLGPLAVKPNTSEPSITTSLNSIIFSNCSIGSIDSFSFHNYTLSILHFNHSSIESIQPNAIDKSKIHSLAFSGTNLKNIGKHSVENSKISKFDFESMDIGAMESEWLTNCTVGSLRIFGSKIEEIEKNTFGNCEIDKCQVDGNRIMMMDSAAFHGNNQISSLSITGNDLSTSSPSPSLLPPNPSHHPTTFLLANNTLDCSPDDCSTNSFLLNSPKHSDILFQIAANRCRPPVHSPCVEPRTLTLEENGITCRISSLIADCACVASTSSLPPRFLTQYASISIVIIGDCEHLVLDQNSADFSQIYIFRTAKLMLYNLPKTLKVLKVFHSTISLLRSGKLSRSKKPQSWQISHSKIDTIDSESLTFLNLDSLSLDHSRIAYIPPKSTRNSSIQRLIIDHCHVESTQALFEISASLRMEHSLVFSSPRGLGTIASAQLQNNTLLECCRQPYVDYRNPMGLDAIEVDPRCGLHFYGSRCYTLEEVGDEKMWNLPIKSATVTMAGCVYFSMMVLCFVISFILSL
uniref:Uncharacterized protein n=1 Tax=Caenorhabditis japonica TaxID=281687 RepID=A0A8R1I027_CAEJA